ncbi:MAG: hypothetical protein H6581_06915 [Bacteroidia bacterium]|nr:hypothetical protein [Bacteroidia bacterium]
MEKFANETEYEKALERLEELLLIVGNDTDPESPEFIELDQLSDKIADYEEAEFPFEMDEIE